MYFIHVFTTYWCLARGTNEPIDPFASDLPDIDVEEDLKTIREKNKAIDDDMDVIGMGVAKLKEIALDMGQVFNILTKI